MNETFEEEKVLSKIKKYQNLIEEQKELDEELKDWKKKSAQTYGMNLLHKYNEIKDATQILLGAIANIEEVTVKELHERFELPTKE